MPSEPVAHLQHSIPQGSEILHRASALCRSSRDPQRHLLLVHFWHRSPTPSLTQPSSAICLPPSLLPRCRKTAMGEEATRASPPALAPEEKTLPHNEEQQQDQKPPSRRSSSRGWLRTLVAMLSYVPPRCRYDPDRPFQFSMGLNILFGKSKTYTIMQAVSLTLDSFCRMLHGCESVLQPSHSQSPREGLQCVVRAVILRTDYGSGRLCGWSAPTLSAWRPDEEEAFCPLACLVHCNTLV